MKLKGNNEIIRQNEILIKDSLISREEFIRSKEDLDMAIHSQALFTERQKQDSLFRSVNVETLKNDLVNMRKNLAVVRGRVDNLNVTAPIDGELGLLSPEIGQTSTAVKIWDRSMFSQLIK